MYEQDLCRELRDSLWQERVEDRALDREGCCFVDDDVQQNWTMRSEVRFECRTLDWAELLLDLGDELSMTQNLQVTLHDEVPGHAFGGVRAEVLTRARLDTARDTSKCQAQG